MEAGGGARSCAPCTVEDVADTSATSELELLLGKSFAGRTPTVTYLGVSPPVRSGAANPFCHDRSWTRSAYSASHSNLQALRGLDSTGESFLRAGPRHAPGRLGGSAGSMTVDAAALVLTSPDLAPPSVLALAAAAGTDYMAGSAAEGDCRCSNPACAAAGAVQPSHLLRSRSGCASVNCGRGEAAAAATAAPTAGRAAMATGCCGSDAEESASDAGSEATIAAAAATAAAATAEAEVTVPQTALVPAAVTTCTAAVAQPAASALRARLLGTTAGVAPVPNVLAGHAVTVDGPRVSALRPPAAPRAANKPQPPVLEPFTCQTLYYA